MSDVLSAPAELRLQFEAGEVTVGLSGEIDHASTAEIAHALAGLAHRRRVTIDLSGVTFFGAAGLGILARLANAAAARGEVLTVTNAPSTVRRLLRVVGIEAHVLVIEPDASAELVGRLLHDGVWLQFAANIGAALRMLTALAHEAVDDAVGVSVSLQRPGHVVTVAASGPEVAAIDEAQYDLGEGPCVEAASTARQVCAASIGDHDRWPAFGPVAQRAGVGGVLSTPIMTGVANGAINVYSRRSGFTQADRGLGSTFAEHAAAVITDMAGSVTVPSGEEQLRAALRERSVIAQAEGVLIAAHGVSADAAAGDIRRTAKARAITVLEHCERIIEAAQGGAR